MLAIRPIVTNNMATVTISSTMSGSGLGPTKNWIIPPRPKPGRKPATDTPPTKRKAQNRAAQRAFRERRAARVGELEEQLKETEEERQKREGKMCDQINEQNDVISKLEDEVQRLREEAATWRDRYYELQQRFEDQKSEKDHMLLELDYVRNGSKATGTDAVPLPPRRQQRQDPTPSTIVPRDAGTEAQPEQPIGCGGCTATSNCACVETAISIAAAGCGKCTLGSHCECLDETLKATELETPLADLKRSHTTVMDTDGTKRPRYSIEQSTRQEIDFTAHFSQSQISQLPHNPSRDRNIPSVPAESCGFCADGTYCACAEAVGSNENRLAPLLNEVTPPPSDTDAGSADCVSFKLPPLHPNHRIHHPLEAGRSYSAVIPKLREVPTIYLTSAQESCSEAPGSCKQCQEDPKSGLFCRSLAAVRASNSSENQTSSACCGGGDAAGTSCCRRQESKPTAILSCAEAYNTLKVHKSFDQATDNINEWLPKLHASLSRYPGRAPLDIEAASVMNVIKYFDVRFGRGDGRPS